ncbi:MAG: hypothetical protein HN929_04615 [Chloroflexi bacterium]|jgi:hypothetical protein|nr:hypothetical protein [Chloroflexota bacterium]MBT7080737.1 hypothetical protein [Chloroflexota bacterium]MBT7290880.1 hypothetical protein [Chloroflexota bacterium]
MHSQLKQHAKTPNLKRFTVSILFTVVLSCALILGFAWKVGSNPLQATALQSVDVNTYTEVAVKAEPDTNMNNEPARYNLSSVQTAYKVSAGPGQEVTSQIYFYNVDGNRTTKISLDAIELPDGWKVKYSSRNLKVSPMGVSAEPITDVPDGMVALTLPNKLGDGIQGYCLAHVVTITVQVPAEAAMGTVGDITIEAKAKWSGQTGMAVFGQTRKFGINVTVNSS